jgi:hypothetical protein
MLIMLFTLGYVLSVGIWARPLVNNATIKLSELFSTKSSA